ncbi:MAG: alpha/beta hydrolase fold domain-containing protein, partial [Paracoccus sp. (in: a-proteobacteria)]|nr:alpha/beta hydrolase fold domain-containing protein [Paracoccus sp. (in: a-proteobacteria)]
MLYHVTDWDAAYANTVHIPGGEGFPDRWAAAAADFRARHPPEDAGAGHLYLPDVAPKGLMVFIHGGYWMACAPGDFSHLAAGALARGWAVLMPGYDKAPAARIAQITAQVAGQIAAAAGRIAGPVALTGHSVGGHLAARMICPGVLPDAVLARVRACVP